MRDRSGLKLAVAVLLCGSLSLGLTPHLSAEQPGSILTSTKGEREELALTVYQQNLGLVSEVRPLRLQPGLNQVNIQDVPKAIDPSSAQLQFMTQPEQIKILEHNFKYDVVNAKTLLQKYIGQSIELHEKIEGQIKEKITPATLLGVGDPNVYRIDNQLHLGHPGRVVVNSLPEGLTTEPQFSWLLKAEQAIKARCRITYLTGGLSWSAEYLAIVAPDEGSLSLEGWVSIDNQSGAAYEDASIKLLAGKLQRYSNTVRPMRGNMLMQRAAAAPLKEQALSEYQLYTLAGLSSLPDNQTKQIRLMQAASVPAKKIYVLENQASSIQYRRANQQKNKIPVKAMLKFVNQKADNLGMSLPQGRIRVFKADAEQALQLIGEDRLSHTPEGEEIKITLGEVHDIVGEYVQLEYTKLGQTAYQTKYQVTLRNHKSIPVKVTIQDHFSGDWRITEASVPFTKKDARTAEAIVKIAASGEEKITYTIRVER